MATMSTPISKIPINQNNPIQGESNEDDPEVLAVLNEVHQPIPHTIVQSFTPPVQHHNMYNQQPMMIQHVNDTSKWVDSELAKRAIAAAIIATVLFYPQTMQMVYEKVPFMAKFTSYDIMIRAALLAIVLYLIMWKLNL